MDLIETDWTHLPVILILGEQFLPELQVSLYSVAPTIGLHSTLMDELVYEVTLKFDTYPRGAGEQNA